ncbi:LysE family transporter [Streptococcus macacae]|uniref:Translocator protein, LysE family n=1 Tax=Streptococcus macacae NCTC 11558 TaxID=764298 RepID=G5JX68_9STRE|nr:LysE family transporter [Streptococcus macacae]EHJ52798.1 translocator protein, LysE family [Streptococcus macacae NCTC 11558]SUN77841.1 Cysteine/O-acetylserine efflux protein [Streptococcus macacae NCTC 11558]
MVAFIIFLIIMSFTPGPNTILAMDSGQKNGFRKSIPYNLGIGAGVIGVGLVAMCLGEFIKSNTFFITMMKIIGSAYLLYLAYHVFLSQPVKDEDKQDAGFQQAFFLQFSNIKTYLYAITSFTGFSVFSDLPFIKLLLLALIGMIGTFLWTIGGSLMKAVYNHYYRIFNSVIALLLVFSAYDLWH